MSVVRGCSGHTRRYLSNSMYGGLYHFMTELLCRDLTNILQPWLIATRQSFRARRPDELPAGRARCLVQVDPIPSAGRLTFATKKDHERA